MCDGPLRARRRADRTARVTVLVGLDVGTSGVKALALSATGDVLARAEREYPLSTPRPGLGRAGSGGLVARGRGGAARRGAARRRAGGDRLSGQMHGLVVLDEHGRVLRPAILWNDQRTAAECEEIEERVGPRAADRADRQPRADRLHRAEAALAAQARARDLRADPPRAAAEGLRALPADRRAGDRRRRRVRHAPLRRRAAAAGATRCWRRWSCPREWLPPRTSRPRSAAPATRRRARSASGSTGRGRSRSCSARPASSSPRCPSTGRSREARLHTFCHAVPGTWHAMGVMLSAAGSLQWLRGALGGAPYESCSPRRSAGSRASRACSSSRTSRASGRRTPTRRARRVHRPLAPPRPRRARARGARGRRLRARATRSSSCARSASRPRSAGVSGGGARSELWLRIVASVLGLPLERTDGRGGRGVRRGAARRRQAAGVFADAHEAVARVRARPRPDRARPGLGRAYEDGYARYRELYPALRPLS